MANPVANERRNLPQGTATDPIVALLNVHVIEAKDLPKVDVFGLCDPYVKIRFGLDTAFKTKIIKKDLNPHWNETFKVLVLQSQKKYNIEFDVFDWDKLSKNDLAGKTTFDISTFTEGDNNNFVRDVWLPLTKEGKTKTYGSLHVRIEYKTKEVVEREFWNAFARYFDADKTNTISFLEFCAMAEAIGSNASNDDLFTEFTRADTDESYTLSFDEFTNMMTSDIKNSRNNVIASSILPEGTTDFIWHISACANMETHNVGDLVLERGFYGAVERKQKEGEIDKIVVQDRETGKLVDEKIPEFIRVSLRMMYSTGGGRFAVDKLSVHRLLKHLTDQQGKKYSVPASKKEIQPFIEYHNLNVNEVKDSLDSFANFNEFFYRKLKDGVRPVAQPANPFIAVSPADSRFHVFSTISDATNLWIKGKHFNLKTLLQDEQLANQYDNGSLVISRLAPQDYHRFHVPIDGTVKSIRPIHGSYYTVNPIAVKTHVDVYTENKRTVISVESPQFGQVLYIAVGATMVGSIVLSVHEGQQVKRGDEMGYFAFGGSTILVLFKKNSIEFDEDLLANSAKPIETLVKYGQSIGRVPGH